jgi:hypothetical protein
MERIEQFRKIVREKQYGEVDGVTVDLFSASAVVQVHDALNETNRAKFLSLTPFQMVKLAFRFV